MMKDVSSNPSLGEAARLFLTGLPVEKSGESQQAVYRFVRWYGWEKPCAAVSAPAVASFAAQLSFADRDYAAKLELIRAFLTYARKQGWTGINLAVHLKIKKGKIRPQSTAVQVSPNAVLLTREGYDGLEAELVQMKEKRLETIKEMTKAAADKDFRENAPLAAAREQRSHLEGRIKEVEGALKSAAVIGEQKGSNLKVKIGDSVLIADLSSEEEISYVLVSPAEVDPTKGKISSVSPLGKAIIGRGQGEVVEVKVPSGQLRYEIKRIGA